MKTEYKYFEFIHDTDTNSWICKTNKKVGATFTLGTVEYYPPWKQYCYFPSGDTVYSDTCLKDIADFLQQLKNE